MFHILTGRSFVVRGGDCTPVEEISKLNNGLNRQLLYAIYENDYMSKEQQT